MIFAAFERVLGIEIGMLPEGVYSCCYALISRKGNSMKILDEKRITGSLVKVLESLPRKYPVAVSISGRGVLHKQIQQAEDSQASLFNVAFPSVEKQDFFVQELMSGNNAWISIVRKTLAEDMLNKLCLAGLKVYALSLGGLPVAGIWGMLEGTEDGLNIDGHSFRGFQDGRFSGYEYTQGENGSDKVVLGGNKVSASAILPYALAFQLFLHDRVEVVKADCRDVDQAFHGFLQDLGIKKTVKVFIFALLGLLLFSFLVLSHFNEQNAVLSEKAGHLTATADQSDVLKKEIFRQKKQLADMGWNGGYNYAFLLDEIGSSRPKLLNLTQVQFGEEKEAIRDQTANLIRISGETTNLTAVNNWIFMLKEKKWVHNVKLLRYQQDIESERYLFNLLIQY